MGACSTIEITKEDAIKLITDNLNRASDSELEDLCYTLWGEKRLRNFSIVNEYNKDGWCDQWGKPNEE